MIKLNIELVPHSTWGENLRKAYTEDEWNNIRKAAYKRANHTCQICGKTECMMEAHEIWAYSEDKATQTFVGLEVLCTECHKSKHLGYAMSTFTEDKLEEILQHIKKVNSFTDSKLVKYVKNVFTQWHERNKIEWSVIFPEYEELMQSLINNI